MAYDPKAYLDRALKEGFQSVYSQPSSLETGEAPQYQGDVATFGNVQVRPLMELVGETEQSSGTGVPSGHMVSVPLTGQYQGYFRNDIYDNDGNFVKTTISEPDTDKYGIKSLAQLGLTAASFGGLGTLASTLAKGYSAIQSKNPLALLSAATGMPGAENVLPTMPTAINDVLKYAGQASDIAKAVKGDPSAIFKTIVGAAKSGSLPKGLMGDVDLSGADAIEGFFAPGGEGYDPAQEDISSLLARYPETGSIVDVAGTADDWYQEGAIPVYSGVPEWDDALDAALQTGKVPGEVGQTITTTARQDNTSIDPWLQPFLTDSSDTQVIDITGTLPKKDVIIPDWDIMEEPDRTPGSPTDTTPQPPTFDDDRTVGTTPATSGTGRTGGTGGTRSTTPATPPAQSGLDYQKLAYIFGLLGGQRPKEEEQYQAAQWQPLDRELMYGLRG